MQLWMKLAMSFFVFSLVLAGLIVLMGPGSLSEGVRDPGSPVGQISADHTETSVGQPAVPK